MTNKADNQITKSWLFAIAFILSACSILYELLIAKAIAKLCGSVIFWESLTIGTYIGFLGLGVFFYSIKQRDTFKWLCSVEFILTLLGSCSVIYILFLHIVYRIYVRDDVIYHDLTKLPAINYFGLTAQIPTILIGFFSGMELPALMDLTERLKGKNRINFLLGIYYIGALVGTLLFGLILLPYLDTTYTAIFVASLNLIVLLALTIRSFSLTKLTLMATAGLVILSSFLVSDKLSEYQIKNNYFNKEAWVTDEFGALHIDSRKQIKEVWDYLDGQPEIKRYKSLYQTIDIVPNRKETVLKEFYHGKEKINTGLYLDGHFQLSTAAELEYHEHLAHIPIQIFHIPENVLILGGGDGGLVREFLKYGDRVKSIKLVEIDPMMLELAKTNEYFLKINKNALSDPKVEVIADDAFRYLRWDKTKYDAIYIDFPYPFNFDALRLYSREMAHLISLRIKKGGFAAMDAPLEINKKDVFTSVLYNTLLEGGFKKIIGFKSRQETFATFVTDNREIPFTFSDYGVQYTTFGQDYFRSNNTKVFNDTPDKSMINTLLKPRLFDLVDRSF